jgi:hypothetical protein
MGEGDEVDVFRRPVLPGFDVFDEAAIEALEALCKAQRPQRRSVPEQADQDGASFPAARHALNQGARRHRVG